MTNYFILFRALIEKDGVTYTDYRNTVVSCELPVGHVLDLRSLERELRYDDETGEKYSNVMITTISRV